MLGEPGGQVHFDMLNRHLSHLSQDVRLNQKCHSFSRKAVSSVSPTTLPTSHFCPLEHDVMMSLPPTITFLISESLCRKSVTFLLRSVEYGRMVQTELTYSFRNAWAVLDRLRMLIRSLCNKGWSRP